MSRSEPTKAFQLGKNFPLFTTRRISLTMPVYWTFSLDHALFVRTIKAAFCFLKVPCAILAHKLLTGVAFLTCCLDLAFKSFGFEE